MRKIRFAKRIKEDPEILKLALETIEQYELDKREVRTDLDREFYPSFTFSDDEKGLAFQLIKEPDNSYVINWYIRYDEYLNPKTPREFKEYTLSNGRKVKICFFPNFPSPEGDEEDKDEYPDKDLVLKFVLECLENDDTPVGEEAAYYDIEKYKITVIFKRLSEDEYEIEEYYRCHAVIDKRNFE
ncbi:hypothetical protein [Anaerocellum danielii]|uniref:Uncharacterized protein n=1 Tax=Anaerocellum danielii TaxID=1387557 RepID=A0ABZ0U0R0_9FIRM|nr:hypothetical protein [Caldicellulosiruptor danielii]WPX08203.1 hypothetical protein SOJ16_002069 [Caldicellulosiruptor danielii]